MIQWTMVNSGTETDAGARASHGAWVVFVNLIILVVLLGGIEVAARARGSRLGRDAYHPGSFMDRWTGWRNAPDYQLKDIRHDAQGFRRDQPVQLAKPHGTVRIFLLGGSTAYGFDGLFKDLDPQWKRLDNREVVDAWLERALTKNHPERHWEVINAAVNEYRMHQNLALIYSKLLAYKPDLVIFLDGHNDMSGIMAAPAGPYDPYEQTPHNDLFTTMVYPHTLTSWFIINATWLRNNSVAWNMLQNRLASSAPEKAFGSAPDSNRPEPVPVPVKLSDLDAPLQEHARQQLALADYYPQEAKRLDNILKYEGIQTLFTMQPELVLSHKKLTPVEIKFADHMRKISGRYTIFMYENLQPAISASMSVAAKEKGFGFVDLKDVFDGTAEKTFTDYCHLTPLGNELVADRMYAAMAPEMVPSLIEKTR